MTNFWTSDPTHHWISLIGILRTFLRLHRSCNLLIYRTTPCPNYNDTLSELQWHPQGRIGKKSINLFVSIWKLHRVQGKGSLRTLRQFSRFPRPYYIKINLHTCPWRLPIVVLAFDRKPEEKKVNKHTFIDKFIIQNLNGGLIIGNLGFALMIAQRHLLHTVILVCVRISVKTLHYTFRNARKIPTSVNSPYRINFGCAKITPAQTFGEQAYSHDKAASSLGACWDCIFTKTLSVHFLFLNIIYVPSYGLSTRKQLKLISENSFKSGFKKNCPKKSWWRCSLRYLMERWPAL